MARSDDAAQPSLLVRIQSGDTAAVMEAYEQHVGSLYRYVRLRVVQAELAEDIVSEVFVTLLDCVGQPCAPKQHLRGWLFKIARTQLYEHGNARLTLAWDALEDWMPTLIETNPEHTLGDVIDRQRLQHALQMLNSDHREVLLLRFGHQFSLQETADALDKTVSSVKSIQFRALQNLRQIMKPDEAEVAADNSEEDQQPQKGGALWNSRS
ncbi:MAG: RNA polymerase sigma factor [Anaerolineae bacterium]|nr:RNA polymerase sigma factor [Anaerolineae bacterium]